ncbi:MAG: hypothetical protein RR512_05395 [Coprobacillus sp.]
MRDKKKYIILGVILSSFLVFCFMTLLPHNKSYMMDIDKNKKNIIAVKSEDNNSSDKFENLYSFAVKINNEVLQVPTSLSDFIKSGWKSTNEIGSDTFEFVPIEHTEFTKNNIKMNVSIEATEVYPLTMDKYYISSLLLTEDLYKDIKVEFPKDIVLASSNKEAILEAYGDPDDIWTYENEPEKMFYKYDKNQMIMFTLNDKGILSEALLTYEKPKKGLNFSVIDKNQKQLERLPNKFNGNMYMLDNVVYNLPDKAEYLLENGWSPVENEEFVADGADEMSVIELKKEDQIINVELRNPNDKPSPIGECYVVSVSFDLDKCQNFGFAGGFNKSSTIDDFKKLKKDFQTKEVHITMQDDIMAAYRIKTGKSSQFEVLMDYENNSKIKGYKITNYPK